MGPQTSEPDHVEKKEDGMSIPSADTYYRVWVLKDGYWQIAHTYTKYLVTARAIARRALLEPNTTQASIAKCKETSKPYETIKRT